MTMEVAMTKQGLKRRLEQEQKRLGRLIEGETVMLQTEAENIPDEADIAAEVVDRGREAQLQAQLEAELEAVEHALARVADGGYGVCEACGKPIPEARLEVRPAARYCIEDQARVDRENRRLLE